MAFSLFDDSFPTSVMLKYTNSTQQPIDLNLNQILPNKRVLFTSVGRDNQLPAYFNRLDDIKNKGVDKIVLLSTNDPIENYNSLVSTGITDEDFVVFATDPEAALSSELGESYGSERRNSDYTAIVDDGRITYLSDGHDDNMNLLLRLNHSFL